MSKAFDSVNRNILLSDLGTELEKDELHMVQILLKDVNMRVKNSKTIGEQFLTTKGIPQGDCLSPVLFTLYLAKALKENLKVNNVQNDHSYAVNDTTIDKACLNEELKDHSYSHYVDKTFCIDQQFADDIGWVSTSKQKIVHIKETIPNCLKERNLDINLNKTEEYNISRHGLEDWKKCKYLGSLLGTEEDIKRRKMLAIVAFNKYKYLLTTKKLAIKTRIRLFNVYIGSVFLYNAELWYSSTKVDSKIDTFHRSLLRKILKIKWPYKISNIDLYNRTLAIKWSIIIKTRRLRWLGHVMRLPEKTATKTALYECLRPAKKIQGKPKSTWLGTITKDLQELDESLTLGSVELERATNNRDHWRRLLRGSGVLKIETERRDIDYQLNEKENINLWNFIL